MNVVSQLEFGALVRLLLVTSGNVAELLGTREHFGGTPPTWTLDVPDLQGVPGFQDSWRFPNQSLDWTLIVTGQPWGFEVKNATSGDLFRTAHLRGTQVGVRRE